MLLSGTELAGYVKQRQSETLRSLSYLKARPHLVIIQTNKEVVSDKFVELKRTYGQDIGAEVSTHNVDVSELESTIKSMNKEKNVHGLIVQLPLPSGTDQEFLLNMIEPVKDVDALGSKSIYSPAAPTAVLWLLSGYDIGLEGKSVVIVGQGRLVGKPLAGMLVSSGVDVSVCDENTADTAKKISAADVIITATGQTGLIKPDMVKTGVVVVDAGTTEQGAKLVGDADQALYERSDIKISPVPGGVGPLTVSVLFENLIIAFKRQVLE